MAKLPVKLYVTSKDQGTDLPPFGFLHAYEPGKAAFEKRRLTQETWAYHTNSVNGKIEEQNGVWYLVGTRWMYDDTLKYDDPGYRYRAPLHEVLRNPPLIWNNDPLEGFRITKSVSRWSTSNKLWRILDPRGIEFEISTGVLEQIIDDATILKGGVIDAKCIWMANKNLVVA